MRRSDFGAWGADLSEGDFGKALAALGVLAGAGLSPADNSAAIANELNAISQGPPVPLAWRLPSTWLPNAEPSFALSARALADGWQASQIASSTRLEIDQYTPLAAGFDRANSLPWLAEQLSHDDVYARSVYVRVDEPHRDVTWRWPLRVGVLRDDRSRALGNRLNAIRDEESWLQPLVSVVDVGGAARSCDLLILPLDLRAALATVAALSAPPRADCVLVLGRVRGAAEHWYRELVGLRATARTAGVGIAHVAAESIDEWFKAIIGSLSHNEPIDVALVVASRHADRPPAFLAASRRLVEFSRLATQLKRMAKRLEARGVRDRSVEMANLPTAERMLGRGPGSRTLGEVAGDIRAIAEEPGEHFLHESDMATAAAEIREAAEEPAMATLAPHERAAPRFVQAQVFDVTNPGQPVRRTKSLRTGAPHEITVRIGMPDEDRITAPSDQPFPTELLPPDEEMHELTVVFTEPQLLEEPAVARITLPRSGNSTECRFYLPASTTVTALDARVIILHENRVLQTALIRGPMAAGADGANAEGPITVAIEAVVRLALTDLDQRTRFDAALVVNHAPDGAARVTSIADDRARGIRVSPDMQKAIDWIDGRLSDVANDKKSYEDGLQADATVNLLREFARFGSLLYRFVVKNQIGEGGLARGERIQIISATADGRLPAELMYDRRAPEKDAPLCPNAAESLKRGTCDAACPKGAAERTVVCPLGFWGLSRIIERHSHDPDLANALPKDFVFRSDPVTGRETLEVATAGLVAGSQRVEKTVAGGLKTICEAITKGSATAIEPIATWDTWVEKLPGASASLLVLIVHTEDADGSLMQRMEIGKESWLEVIDMDERHVRPDPQKPGPIVLLLGCETGAPEVTFAGFVSQCREYGAAIVVASGSKIHSVHAVPVAKRFVETLRKEISGDGATFGEVMRVVRRDMLASGLPMVLSLTAYGDADWRLAAKFS